MRVAAQWACAGGHCFSAQCHWHCKCARVRVCSWSACMHPCVHACVHAHFRACVHACAHTSMRVRVCVCMHAGIRACMQSVHFVHGSLHPACARVCVRAAPTVLLLLLMLCFAGPSRKKNAKQNAGPHAWPAGPELDQKQHQHPACCIWVRLVPQGCASRRLQQQPQRLPAVQRAQRVEGPCCAGGGGTSYVPGGE